MSRRLGAHCKVNNGVDMAIDEADNFSIKSILEQSETEVAKLDWEGTFSNYLSMVVEDHSISQIYALIYILDMSFFQNL